MEPGTIKSKEEIKLMAEGGKRLARIKGKLRDAVSPGVSAFEVEDLALRLMEREDVSPSFKMVPGYSWATCINVNDGLVHGIPKKEVIFKKGDLVSVDVGTYYKGFHTDTSFSMYLGKEKQVMKFLDAGESAIREAISKVIVGNRIWDISEAVEKNIKKSGYKPIRALVGHGIGRNLHEKPEVPCFTYGKRQDSPIIREGMTLAIEVMYVMGSPEIKRETDGWTISTHDGKISALYEETVAATADGPSVLTKG